MVPAERNVKDLQQAVEQLEQQICAVLSPRCWFWRVVWSPERRKVLETLPEEARELLRLAKKRSESEQGLDSAVERQLMALLSRDPRGMSLEESWGFAERLQMAFLSLVDAESLRTLLLNEQVLEGRGADWEEPWPYYGWGRVRWRDAFDPAELCELIDGLGDTSSQAQERAIERLNLLYRMRSENGRKRRTRLALRDRFFLYSLAILAPFVSAMLLFTVWAGAETSLWAVALLAAVSGAVGGTVSGTLKLRDLIRITEFRLVGVGLLVQPFVGAAVALFLLCLLQSKLLGLPEFETALKSWAAVATYGFVAGFSEPFWLGLVRRVAGLGSEGAQRN